MNPLADVPDWRLALVESAAHPDGVRYKPLADWPLLPEGDAPLHFAKGTRPSSGNVPLKGCVPFEVRLGRVLSQRAPQTVSS